MPDPNSPTRLPGEDPPLPPTPPAAAARVPGPEEFGPYRILDTIGEGGFGVVYLAEQREPVRRRVALKVLKAGMDTDEIIARFEAERQALAVMDHPGVAKVFDAGRTPGGRPYFAMELVPGETITAFCDRHQLSTRERLRVFVDVCHAVQHAHTKGIIHRDLKPSNILVVLVDGRPVPKVIDFGIAKATSGPLTDSTLYTQAGRMMGTPEYMSPEQASGLVHDLDTRTDVFSLGVVLYELLAGALPFDPSQLRHAAYDEVRRIIREVDPPPPSSRIGPRPTPPAPGTPQPPTPAEVAQSRRTDIHSLIRQVRGELDWITMKALEKDRSRRYESPSALAGDIERHLEDRPVLAGPPSAAYRARKFFRRHRAGVLTGAGAVVLVLGSLVALSAMYARAEAQRARAEDALTHARTEQAKSDASLKFLAAMFGGIDPDQAQGREVTVREMLDAADQRAGTELQAQPEVEASVRSTLGEAFHAIGRDAQSQRQFERAVELRAKALGERDEATLESHHNLGAVLLSTGEFDRAEAQTRQALEGRRAALGPSHVDTLASLSMHAFALQNQGKIEEAVAEVREALRLQEQTLGEGHKDTVDSRASLADMLNDLGQFEEAVQVGRRNTEIATRTLGPTHSKTLEARSILASSLKDLDRLDEAMAETDEVIGAKERLFGPEHQSLLVALNLKAQILTAQKRDAEGEPLRRRLVATATKALGPDHPTTLVYMNNLAQCLHTQKKLDEAREIYLKVIDARRRVSGERDVDTLIAMNNLGLMLVDAKQPAEGLPYLQKTLEGLKGALPEGHWMIGASSGYVGECLRDLGRLDEAERVMLDGYAVLAKALGEQHSRARDAAKALAGLYDAKQQPEQAEAWRAKSKAPADGATPSK